MQSRPRGDRPRVDKSKNTPGRGSAERGVVLGHLPHPFPTAKIRRCRAKSYGHICQNSVCRLLFSFGAIWSYLAWRPRNALQSTTLLLTDLPNFTTGFFRPQTRAAAWAMVHCRWSMIMPGTPQGRSTRHNNSTGHGTCRLPHRLSALFAFPPLLLTIRTKITSKR